MERLIGGGGMGGTEEGGGVGEAAQESFQKTTFSFA